MKMKVKITLYPVYSMIYPFPSTMKRIAYIKDVLDCFESIQIIFRNQAVQNLYKCLDGNIYDYRNDFNEIFLNLIRS